ncbi:MAG: four helix bundle protein [Ignavibacteria bacterium]|nr:four helix bundle protein [Ignavibacteria bacterium]
MANKIHSFEDMDVYQKLLQLHLEVHELTMTFPKFELYELGSQLRRSSNSAPANFSEGWNNKHINIYLEEISRALGEIRESKHHLTVGNKKKYFSLEKYNNLIERYDECSKMLHGLENSLHKYKP